MQKLNVKMTTLVFDAQHNYVVDPAQPGTVADILNGTAGGDSIYGGTVISAEQAILNGNTDSATGLKGDWLAGCSGDDTLITGTGIDVLSGGGGNDLLIAGAGDDFILGDADYQTTSPYWMRRRTRAAIINSGKAANDEVTHTWRIAA